MTTSDNPAQESGQSLDTNQAADAFASLLSPPEAEPPKEEKQDATPATAEVEETPEQAAERIAAEELAEKDKPVEQDNQEGAKKIPVTVDGKVVELTPEEIAEHYKNGLRQADYTRKTMEAAEARKTAEAESSKAKQERQQYAQNLQMLTMQLQGALQEQAKIDWQKLIDENPTEYMKQKHLFEERQAAFQRAQGEQARLHQQEKAEQAKQVQEYLVQQHQALLDKLPEWKDTAKAQAEQSQVVKFMVDSLGYDPKEIIAQHGPNGEMISPGVADHRIVLMAREAMKYRELMAKAQAARNKVAPLPPKVERPGNGEASKIDGRTEAMKRLSKTGRIEDAAAAFAKFL